MSFIQDRYIRVFKSSEHKEITQWISSKNHFITDANSFIFNQKSRWNMQALTDFTLYTICTENYKLLNTIQPNWHKIEQQFIASCFSTLEDCVFNLLSLSAEKRYQHLFSSNKGLFDGTHKFTLTTDHLGNTCFNHSETFSDLLVPLFKNKIDTGIKEGFIKMNNALKIRAKNI